MQICFSWQRFGRYVCEVWYSRKGSTSVWRASGPRWCHLECPHCLICPQRERSWSVYCFERMQHEALSPDSVPFLFLSWKLVEAMVLSLKARKSWEDCKLRLAWNTQCARHGTGGYVYKLSPPYYHILCGLSISSTQSYVVRRFRETLTISYNTVKVCYFEHREMIKTIFP